MSHAHTILTWEENLPEEETPPEWMWSLDEELEEWFEEIKAARAQKYSGGGGNADEHPPMMENLLTKDRKR